MDSNIKTRAIQYSTIDKNGILASYTIMCVQKDNNRPKISSDTQTLQVYSNIQLKDMLERNGFKVMEQCGIDEKRFVETKSDRIVIAAKKR